MIDWGAFVVVGIASLVGASLLVTLAALGFRWADAGENIRLTGKEGGARWHRIGSVIMFAACALVVLYGIYLIVPAFN